MNQEKILDKNELYDQELLLDYRKLCNEAEALIIAAEMKKVEAQRLALTFPDDLKEVSREFPSR